MTFYGPVSTAATDSNPILGVVGFVAVATFISVQLIVAHRRSRAIYEGVAERGWQWIGEALPYYFPVRDLIHSNRELRIESAFSGTIRGVDFICCDCILGQGKHRAYLTLVGAKSVIDPFSVTRFDSAYQTTNADGWFGLTLSGTGWSGSQLMSAKQIFALIESIG